MVSSVGGTRGTTSTIRGTPPRSVEPPTELVLSQFVPETSQASRRAAPGGDGHQYHGTDLHSAYGAPCARVGDGCGKRKTRGCFLIKAKGKFIDDMFFLRCKMQSAELLNKSALVSLVCTSLSSLAVAGVALGSGFCSVIPCMKSYCATVIPPRSRVKRGH